MPYLIDQSGKIEQTNKNTVLCLSNDFWDAVLIKAKTKRQLQEIFRRNGQIRNYVLFNFSAGVILLLKRNKKIKGVTIDREYLGKEAIIKKIILQALGKKGLNIETYFSYIGKKALAHHYAHDIAAKKIKAKKIISLKEIKMTEVGKRLKNA